MKNSLLIVVDALRYDTLSCPHARRKLFPTLAKLADQSAVARVTTNAQATQFVMPALFSQTYPLDYGGYNKGILNRPRSYIEVLQSAGYDTALFSACNQLSVGQGYDRGFNTRATALDYRLLIEHRISRYLEYYLKAMEAGKCSRDEVIAIIQETWTELLGGIKEHFDNADKSAWSPTLAGHNHRVIAGVDAEVALAQQKPEAVLKKLQNIPAGVYWQFLGTEVARPMALFAARFAESIRWRSRRWLNKRRFPPFILLSHYEAIAPEILRPLLERLKTKNIGTPWHMHVHLMDVHDARAINRAANFIVRLQFLPRWFIGRLQGITRRHWIYDTTLMYVDSQLAKLIKSLEANGELAETCIVLTGDHGSYFALSPRTKVGIATRTYREDIEVPLVVHAPWMPSPTNNGQYDSMSVSASLLDSLGLAGHESFLGRSIFSEGKFAAVSESAGSGNADIATRDLHFTVTGDRYKLMAVLSGSGLTVDKLFDLETDPEELINLADREDAKSAADELIDHLVQERMALLESRGYQRARIDAVSAAAS